LLLTLAAGRPWNLLAKLVLRVLKHVAPVAVAGRLVNGCFPANEM